MRDLLGHFHYYSSVFKNAFDILKGLGVYEHIFPQCYKPKKIIKWKRLKKKHAVSWKQFQPFAQQAEHLEMSYGAN